MKKFYFLCVVVFMFFFAHSEDGYNLWLRYKPVENTKRLAEYKLLFSKISISGNSSTVQIIKNELIKASQGMLRQTPLFIKGYQNKVTLEFLKNETPLAVTEPNNPGKILKLGNEGFIIQRGEEGQLMVHSNTEVGLLYAAFHLLRLMQNGEDIWFSKTIVSIPKIQNRILDHWDNLNRTVERGYAGISIWNWHTLPDYIDQRYIDYARANASIGINGTVLTNVNANAFVLTKNYLLKIKALADIFRPYGIKVYLTAKFSAPIEIGGLKTADPLDAGVQNWWKDKAKEIYDLIPDFGGFLVKANSEGQPGPQNYGRTHADGANMLADAVAPFGGIIMWRAFVYDVRVQKTTENFDSSKIDANAESIASADRFKQAYNEFKPLDGKFRKNVLIQVKNGPIDFQPREPVSPLFGAMPNTPLAMEFQITHEYLGQGTHLVYDAPLFKEVLNAETYANGKGSTVAKIIDGSAEHYSVTAIAGVANIGSERNWTTNPFLQANWYAFGRLAWDYNLSATEIADEWIRQTFTNDNNAVNTLAKVMITSREAVVNYMTPFGLHHIMATGHHYGPGPWISNLGRADWNPVYYHRADAYGIGFDRTSKGSNALAQYSSEVQSQWRDSATCDEKFLLWFHHVSWNYKMKSGRSLWDELCVKYQQGVDSVRWMQQQWNAAKNLIDEERFKQVQLFLAIQEKDAVWWKDACLSYFQTFSQMPLPPTIEKPKYSLDYYQSLRFPFAPGNGGNN